MGRKICITGLCSNLARSFLTVLIKSEIVFSISGIDIAKYFGAYEDRIEMIQADVRDKSALVKAFEGVDVIIHLAFIVISNLPKNFEEIYDININGSKNVFECAAASHVKQIIHFSSVAAYRMSARTPSLIEENSPLEGHLMKNEFYYSYCKGMVENYLNTFEKAHPTLIITRFRPHIITGPHFARNTDNSLRMITQIKSKKKKVYLLQALNATRNLVQLTHEEDLANLTLFAIQSQLHGAYNIAGEPLDFGKYLEGRGKKIKFVSHKILSSLIRPLALVSHKFRVLSHWLNGGKYQVLMKCAKLENLNIPYELKSTQEILEEVVELRKNE